MDRKRFVLAICAAFILTLPACGTANTVPSAEAPSPPISSVPATEIPDASAQRNGDSDAGETVIPFCAHGTGGLASSVRDIRAALPDVAVLDAVGVQRPGMDTPLSTAQATVETWLEHAFTLTESENDREVTVIRHEAD